MRPTFPEFSKIGIRVRFATALAYLAARLVLISQRAALESSKVCESAPLRGVSHREPIQHRLTSGEYLHDAPGAVFCPTNGLLGSHRDSLFRFPVARSLRLALLRH